MGEIRPVQLHDAGQEIPDIRKLNLGTVTM